MVQVFILKNDERNVLHQMMVRPTLGSGIGVPCHFVKQNKTHTQSLCYSPSHIELVEKPGSCAYLRYREDISKTNQGGLSSRSMPPKEVTHYENTVHPK